MFLIYIYLTSKWQPTAMNKNEDADLAQRMRASSSAATYRRRFVAVRREVTGLRHAVVIDILHLTVILVVVLAARVATALL